MRFAPRVAGEDSLSARYPRPPARRGAASPGAARSLRGRGDPLAGSGRCARRSCGGVSRFLPAGGMPSGRGDGGNEQEQE